MELEKVKIRTMKGRIITLSISEKTDTHYFGTDKYGEDVIIAIEDIDSMLSLRGTNES